MLCTSNGILHSVVISVMRVRGDVELTSLNGLLRLPSASLIRCLCLFVWAVKTVRRTLFTHPIQMHLQSTLLPGAITCESKGATPSETHRLCLEYLILPVRAAWGSDKAICFFVIRCSVPVFLCGRRWKLTRTPKGWEKQQRRTEKGRHPESRAQPFDLLPGCISRLGRSGLFEFDLFARLVHHLDEPAGELFDAVGLPMDQCFRGQ